MLKYDQKTSRILLISILAISSSACSFSSKKDTGPRHHVNVAKIPDAVPKVEPLSAGGNMSSYTVLGKTYNVMDNSAGYTEQGIASWYGTKFHGRKTSNGETYSMYKMTAAHKTLPIPTFVEVTNLQNDKSVIVRVNDRGPFHDNRIIDLSYVAAKKLGIAGNGTGFVEVRAIDPRTWTYKKRRTTNRKNLASKHVNQDSLYIQAGAFSSRHNADQLKTQLHALFPNKTIKLAQNDQDRLFRVRVGPVNTVDEADRIAQTISDNGHPTPHVVID